MTGRWLTPSNSAPADTICRSLFIPNDLEWIAIVNGAISLLGEEWNYEQHGAVTPAEIAERFRVMSLQYIPFCLECPMNEFILLQDQKASGNAGGDFTSGAWQQRVLNTEVFDTLSRCSLASNQFTLQPGKYRVIASAPAVECGAHKLRLRNVTDSTDVIGQNAFSYTGAGGPVSSIAVLYAYIVIASAKVFQIDHRCANTRSFYGLGQVCGFGVVEVYTSVWIDVLE